MNRFKLDRRAALRGILGGLSIGIALPGLEAMFSGGSTAFAQATKVRRLGLWFWGNGVKLDRWVPSSMGADWTSPALEPLATSAIKSYVNVVTGMNVKAGNERGHHSGWAALLSGGPILPQDHPNSNYKSTFKYPSIDQQLAKELAPTTKFKTLEVGVSNKVARGEGTTTTYMSHTGQDAPAPAEYNAVKVFDRIFGAGGATSGGTAPAPITEASIALRKSVLDAVKSDITRLQGKVGAADKARLDQHFTNIRAIEERVAASAGGGGSVVSCGKPTAPAAISDGGKEDVKKRNEVMSDLLAVSLACDLTRIFSVHFSGSFGFTNYWQADASIVEGHHDLTHNEPGDQPKVHMSAKFIMQQFNYLLLKLKATPDIDGKSVLDNIAILASSDVADGKAHSVNNYPIVVGGGGSGFLKTPGVHYKSNGENTTNVLYSVMKAAGSKITTAGFDKGATTVSCGAIESGVTT